MTDFTLWPITSDIDGLRSQRTTIKRPEDILIVSLIALLCLSSELVAENDKSISAIHPGVVDSYTVVSGPRIERLTYNPTARKRLADLHQNLPSSVKEADSDLDAQIFHHKFTVSYPHQNNGGKLSSVAIEIRIWNPTLVRYPGWNSPFVEVYQEGTRKHGQLLEEVGMLAEVWAGNTARINRIPKEDFLYIKTINRRRGARSTLIYFLNRETGELEYRGVYFDRKDNEAEGEGVLPDSPPAPNPQKD